MNFIGSLIVLFSFVSNFACNNANLENNQAQQALPGSELHASLLGGGLPQPCQPFIYWPFYYCSWHKVHQADIANLDQYGYSVAIDGDYAVVGAPHYSLDALLSKDGENGAAYVFIRSGTSWIFQQKLLASPKLIPDKNNIPVPQTYVRFGSAVGIGNGRIIIGAPGESNATVKLAENLPPIPDLAGSVYIFELAGGQWTKTGKNYGPPILDPSAATMVHFGARVSVSGDSYAVTRESSSSSVKNSVFVYTITNGVSNLEAQLSRPVEVSGPEAFGDRISLYGNRLAIGNREFKDGVFYDVGEVFV